MTTKNHMCDTIVTALYNLVTPRIEMPVKSITGWMGYGMNS